MRSWRKRGCGIGSDFSIAQGVSLCLLFLGGMVAIGMFDQQPKLQAIIGHLSEHLPFTLWWIYHSVRKCHEASRVECGLPTGGARVCRTEQSNHYEWLLSPPTLQYAWPKPSCSSNVLIYLALWKIGRCL